MISLDAHSFHAFDDRSGRVFIYDEFSDALEVRWLGLCFEPTLASGTVERGRLLQVGKRKLCIVVLANYAGDMLTVKEVHSESANDFDEQTVNVLEDLIVRP